MEEPEGRYLVFRFSAGTSPNVCNSRGKKVGLFFPNILHLEYKFSLLKNYLLAKLPS